MKFIFFSPVNFQRWDWRSSVETGIGGSETSHVEMAWRLANRGHEGINRSHLDRLAGQLREMAAEQERLFDFPYEDFEGSKVCAFQCSFGHDVASLRQIIWMEIPFRYLAVKEVFQLGFGNRFPLLHPEKGVVQNFVGDAFKFKHCADF